ncbi:hypothetical protein Tco_0340030, partial [Tanacetum coccineum]
EVVHKERGDSLVRDATTASSLEAEHDSGNITKTRSKATLNEPSSPGTSSSSGPRCQETIGDTIAQSGFENVSKHSNDLLLARGNILRSGEDSLKLKELMELYTNLQQRVLNLEKTKTTQAEENVSLKRRVKKLEQKKRLRTHKLKRLRKVGATARVESSDDESLSDDASKQGRIDAIDADDDITLVSAVGDKVSTVGAATTVSVATTTTAATVDEITLAQALQELKSTNPKVKGIVFREPGESKFTTTISSQQLQGKSQSQDKGKGIMIEEHVNTLSKKDQLKLDEEIALKLQEEIDEEERIASAEEEKIDEANIAWDDIQEKIDADYQLAERLQAEEQEQFTIEEKATLFKKLLEQRRKHFAAKRHKDLKSKDFDSIKELFDKALKRVNMFVDFRTELVEGSSKRAGTQLEQEIKELMEIVPDEREVAIDDIPLAVKSPSIVDWKIHTEGKKSYYQIIRADGKSQMYMVFSQMLKSFDKKDLEDLYKLVKAKYESTRPVEDLNLVFWNDLKVMFEPHEEDVIWRNQQAYKVLEWKLYDSCGVHFLRMQHMQIYMLVEKKYPLAPFTLSQMLEKKLQIDYESKMAYQLFTAALIDVNAAQSKLVLLENFNENYSKCLRLLVEVTTASTKLLLLEELTTTRGSYYC